jgi:hypothetical protein
MKRVRVEIDLKWGINGIELLHLHFFERGMEFLIVRASWIDEIEFQTFIRIFERRGIDY